MDTERKLHNDLDILRKGKELLITGINATGPIHQGREGIAESLKSGYGVDILVLDPTSEIFFKRAEKEGDMVGRILSEMGATFGGLHDIAYKLGESGEQETGKLTIGLHKYPFCAIVAGYGILDKNKMQANLYPEGKGVRGLTGKTYQLDNVDTPEIFKLGEQYFSALRESSTPVLVSDLGEFRKELCRIGQERYSI